MKYGISPASIRETAAESSVLSKVILMIDITKLCWEEACYESVKFRPAQPILSNIQDWIDDSLHWHWHVQLHRANNKTQSISTTQYEVLPVHTSKLNSNKRKYLQKPKYTLRF